MLQIAICDDNLKFAQMLQGRIRSHFAAVDGACAFLLFTDPQKLVRSDLSAVQILFLDVDMPGLNGIDAAREIRRSYPELFLVFVSAWVEYAPEGYQVNAFRYLLKQRLDEELPACLEDIWSRLAQGQDRLRLSCREGAVDVRLGEILYLEGSSYRMVLVHRTDGSVVECRGKLSDFEAELAPRGFLRIQKSFVVNMRCIRRIQGYRAWLKNGEVLHTTEKNYGPMRDRYLLWRGQQL